jgi:alkanesulfonate monooxygenase SsuD/methylene tetrahydromethanopterin reductase-like flavin-dependent oxidoreductase (luciferase family)
MTATGPARPLGVALTPLETRREVVLHLAVRAEELGYGEFYLAEGWGHDASVLLAEVATRTSRIRLGTGVLNVWGRGAGSLAMLAATLDEVSGGRFTLGLGAGSPQLAEGLHDVSFDGSVRRLEAVTRQVRGLLAGERLAPSVAREHRPLRLGIGTPARVPIHLAALGPRAIRVAGELADGWYPFLLPVTALGEATALLKEGAAQAGSGRPLPRIVPCLPTAVARDPAEAREQASWWVSFYLTSMGPLYRRALRRFGYGAAVDAVLAANPTHRTAEVPAAAQVLLDDLTIWGDAASARAALGRWYLEGADLPVLALPPNRPPAELDYILESMRPSTSG